MKESLSEKDSPLFEKSEDRKESSSFYLSKSDSVLPKRTDIEAKEAKEEVRDVNIRSTEASLTSKDDEREETYTPNGLWLVGEGIWDKGGGQTKSLRRSDDMDGGGVRDTEEDVDLGKIRFGSHSQDGKGDGEAKKRKKKGRRTGGSPRKNDRWIEKNLNLRQEQAPGS